MTRQSWLCDAKTDARRRPTVTLALLPEVQPDLLPPDIVARLQRTADIDSMLPLTSLTNRALARTDILITGRGCPPIDAEVLDSAPRLRAVVHAGSSVIGLVGPDVLARDIAVSCASDADSRSIADYTLAMCVLATKRVFGLANGYASGEDVHDYGLDRSPSSTGATVGVIGATAAGRAVLARLAHHNVRTVVADPSLSRVDAKLLDAELLDLDTLCTISDIVTVHSYPTADGKPLLDHQRLSLMHDGTVLINTSCGSLVDTHALIGHCVAGRLDAVLDVTRPRPLPRGHPLLSLPNVLVTPGLAGAQGWELRRLGSDTVAEIERFARGIPMLGRLTATDLQYTR